MLQALGGIAAADGHAERAVHLASAGAALRTRAGQLPWPHERSALDRWLAPAYQALTEQARRAAWAEGQNLSLDDAIELALAEGQDVRE